MAAYAAAVSLMHIIDLLKNHPSPPISLDKQQFDSLTEVVTFLQEFLESYVSSFSYSDEADPLEMRIADAAYAAEDVIESYIVENIHVAAAAAAAAAASASTTQEDDDDSGNDGDGDDGSDSESSECNDDDDDEDEGDADDNDDDEHEVMESYTAENIQLVAAAAHYEDEQIRYIFYQSLQKVIEAMNLIKKEVMEIEMMREKGGLLKAEQQRDVSAEGGFKSSSIERKSKMVGFDDVRLQLLDKLTGGDSKRQIIPIVGMGGIGKTTLARNVFIDKLIEEHFDIRVWATISLDHDIERTLREVLSQSKGKEILSGEKSVAELGEELHKCLFGRRYLVVMDDMWCIEVWDKIRSFFPECSQRSRIIVTTRMSNLAAHLSNSNNSLSMKMSFLNEVDSWTLFSKIVFGDEESFPGLQLQLRELGEKIVRKCKGLPLSIVVIGGLLARSELTQGYWEYIEKNLISLVNLDNEEYCLRVLKLSYNHLPAHLKPCFLYMGMFEEDSEIKVSTIIKLWVSEGFVKPKEKENLETLAREYFQELVDRNLILADDETPRLWGEIRDRELGSVGMKKLCKMHDLVRDVCLREAKKQRFYYVYNDEHNPSSHRHCHRRIVIPDKTIHHDRRFYGEGIYQKVWLESLPNPRLQIMLESSPPNYRSYVCHDQHVDSLPNFRLLRTLHTTFDLRDSRCHAYSQKYLFGLVNARLLTIAVESKWHSVLQSSISQLWSLHTLIVREPHNAYTEGPVELWNMHQLKHVEFARGALRLKLPPRPNNDNDIVIMKNLHTLIGMVDFHLNEDVIMRIPNLTIFDVTYREKMNTEVHCLSYLQGLTKLESFRCIRYERSGEYLQRIVFPPSLKQIILIDHYYSSPFTWKGMSEKKSTLIEWEEVLQKIGKLPCVEELFIGGGFFGRCEWKTVEGHFPSLKELELVGCGDLKRWTVSEGSSLFPLLQKLTLRRLEDLEEIPSEIGEIATLEVIEVHFCSGSALVSAKKIVEEQEEFHGEERLSFRVEVEHYHGEVLHSLASPNFQVKLY